MSQVGCWARCTIFRRAAFAGRTALESKLASPDGMVGERIAKERARLRPMRVKALHHRASLQY